MQAHPSEEGQQQVSATLDPNARKYVSACAASSTRSSSIHHLPTACAALSVRRRRCHQITQQLGALAAQSSISLEDQQSHGSTITIRLLRFPSNCSHPWFRRTIVGTARCRLSRVAAGRPGNRRPRQRWRTASRVQLRCSFAPSRRAQGHGAPCPRSPLLAQ